MSSIRNPVGPQSPRVYWRRRLVVLLVLLAGIVAIVLVVSSLGSGGTPASSPSPQGGDSTPSATPSPTPAAIEGAPCDPTVMSVVAKTDTNSYAAGQLPQLSFTLTNTGGTSCTYNVGTTQQAYVITSGAEQYWSSKDCETGAIDSELLLEPNTPVTSSALTWDRTRSSTTTCDSARPPVPARGATYRLIVTVGATTASKPTSFLLN